MFAACTSLSGCFLTDFLNEELKAPIPTSIVAPASIKLNVNASQDKYIRPDLNVSVSSNVKFTYSSDNEEVVTVDSNGKLTPHSLGSAVITIVYDGEVHLTTTCKVNVVEEDLSDYTIMYYMCGSDLEFDPEYKDEHGIHVDGPWLFSQDIMEILSVRNIPDSVNIIIETGGATMWHLPKSYLDGADEISSKRLQRWKVENNKLKLIETLNSNYMASESSLEDFLKWGLDNYSADQMGVVFSGHGGGIAGCCYDDNFTYLYGNEYFDRVLRTYEVATACKNALDSSDRTKFTWVGYDCCNMQCADIASINADYFEYMVASQEVENGTGWNHDEYLPYLVNDTLIEPQEFLPKICDSFVNDNHKDSESKANPCLQTLSVLDLSKMDTLTEEFNHYSYNVVNAPSSYSKAKAAFTNSYNEFASKCYGLADFKSFLKQLDLNFSNVNSDKVVDAINDVVIYNKYCSNYRVNICGLDAFFPESVNSRYYLQVGKEDYNNNLSTKFKYWKDFCVQYGNFGWNTI